MNGVSLNSIKPDVEKAIADIGSLFERYDSLQKSQAEELQAATAPWEETLIKANKLHEEHFFKVKALERNYRSLPQEPTRNSVANLVGKTLKNKNNNAKLAILGNLAGKSSLFSKKQNRIAQGRDAMIAKQLNMSKKNYNSN